MLEDVSSSGPLKGNTYKYSEKAAFSSHITNKGIRHSSKRELKSFPRWAQHGKSFSRSLQGFIVSSDVGV